MSKTLDLNVWIDSYSTYMADEALKLLRAKGDRKGPEVYRALCLNFIMKILGSVILETLQERPANVKDNEEMIEYNKKVFGELKMSTQDVVAMAFHTALSHYSGKNVDYFCTIKVVPPSPSSREH